jgi:hypothetical protein
MAMLRSSRHATDDGSASLEFITAGMLLLVPLVYLIIAVASIQAGALAVEGAARQAARVFVQAKNEPAGRAAAATAIRFALDDFGVDKGGSSVNISCSHPTRCLTREEYVTVTVTASVALPLAPPELNVNTPLSVPLTASSTQQVSRFWGAG